MSGISHNQAIKWIHRRLDGMLSESQLSVLEEHMGFCDSCRTYAEEMDLLASRLHHEFQARWDANPGPSHQVIQRLMANAKRIPMTSRFSSSLRVLGGVTALIVLGLAINFFVSQFRNSSPIPGTIESVDISPPAEDRLLAFTSDQSGNFEIYIMYPDGRGLMNITNHPASDTYPFWSPDGTQIAFTSDRGGSHQLYLMDADGSNVVQLTNGEGSYWFDVNRYTPWSPDGRKLIFSHKLPGEQSYKLYVMDLSDQTITALTKEAGQYLLPSWSPGGEYIAFAADTGGTSRDLFIIGRDGTRLTKLTENLGVGEFFMSDYHWSQNGDTLIFTASARVYAAGPDGSLAVMSTADRQILDWWDGTAILDNHEGALTWHRPDGSQSTLDLCQNSRLLGIAHRRSYGGNLVIGSNCSEGGLLFYWANPDGTVVHPLLNAPISWEKDVLFNLTWSPDDHYLAFVGLDTASPDVAERLYLLDVAKAREDPSIQPLIFPDSFGPSWQPASNNDIVEEKVTPTPTVQSTLPPITLQTPSVPGDEPRLVFFRSEPGKFAAWVPVAGDILEYTITQTLFGKSVECSSVGFSLNSASVTIRYCDLDSEEIALHSSNAILEEVRSVIEKEFRLRIEPEQAERFDGTYPTLSLSGNEDMTSAGANDGTFKARIILAGDRVYFVHMSVYQVDWCYCRHQMNQVVDTFYVDPNISIPFELIPTP